MHCRLLIPGAMLPAVPEHGSPPGGGQRFPALETLLARGRRSVNAWHSLERRLLEMFAVARQQDWPSAPYALLGDRGAPGDSYWSHAAPVHLHAGGDRLLLDASAAENLTEAEARALLATIHRHFGASLEVHAAGPARWYAKHAAPPAGATTALREVDGKTIAPASAPLGWQALMNEIQMLFHDHPVNQAREARGEAPVNGVWFWSGGRLEKAGSPGVRSVLAAQPLAVGLAAWTGVRSAAPPSDAQRWLSQEDAEGVHLVVLDELAAPVTQRDPASWHAAMAGLERGWFAPLLQALGSGRIGMVTLELACADRLLQSEATRLDLRRLWRMRRSLDRYFPSGRAAPPPV